MLEKTTYKKFCQKGPPAGGGTFGQAGPTPAWGCHHPQVRHVGWQVTAVGHAALAVAGRVTWRMPAGFGSGGRTHLFEWPSTAADVPALAVAAPPCQRRPRRHVPRVAWPDVPPPIGGLFWQIFRQVVFSSISLAQVVLCVKNSSSRGFLNVTLTSCTCENVLLVGFLWSWWMDQWFLTDTVLVICSCQICSQLFCQLQ
jgi:hypothetical protein